MYNSIKLEKGLYNIASKSFTQALEALDPTSAYEDSQLKGLDAYERQLKRFDIKVNGENCDCVEKFFQTTESAVLFPEFVRRSIKQGLTEASLLPEVVSVATSVNGIDYRGLSLDNSTAVSNTSESEELTSSSITLASESISLNKYGRKVNISYEAIRMQKLDVFALMLKNIARQVSKAINKKAVDTLISGSTVDNIEGTSITYTDLVTFWSKFTDTNLTTLLVSPTTMATILKFDEMKSNTAYINKEGIYTPFGAKLVKTTSIADTKIVGIDSSYALELITGSDIIVDFDKLISTQMESTSFSITIGFQKISSDSARVLSTANE